MSQRPYKLVITIEGFIEDDERDMPVAAINGIARGAANTMVEISGCQARWNVDYATKSGGDA